jgi:hypothetical protein
LRGVEFFKGFDNFGHFFVDDGGELALCVLICEVICL